MSDGVLMPGQLVSVDQYIADHNPGRLPGTYGKEPAANKLRGGNIFLDVASKLVFVQHVSDLVSLRVLFRKCTKRRTSTKIS